MCCKHSTSRDHLSSQLNPEPRVRKVVATEVLQHFDIVKLFSLSVEWEDSMKSAHDGNSTGVSTSCVKLIRHGDEGV